MRITKHQRAVARHTHTHTKQTEGKNEWKNVFRIKVIKVNFYSMNIEYYILFHHHRHRQHHLEQRHFFDEAIFVRSIHLSKYSFIHPLVAVLSSVCIVVIVSGVSSFHRKLSQHMAAVAAMAVCNCLHRTFFSLLRSIFMFDNIFNIV